MNNGKESTGRVQRIVAGHTPSLASKDSSVGEGAPPLPDRRCPLDGRRCDCNPVASVCNARAMAWARGTGERRRRVSGNRSRSEVMKCPECDCEWSDDYDVCPDCRVCLEDESSSASIKITERRAQVATLPRNPNGDSVHRPC